MGSTRYSKGIEVFLGLHLFSFYPRRSLIGRTNIFPSETDLSANGESGTDILHWEK